MAGTVSLGNLVSVPELSHGGASRALSRVSNNNPIVVMRNNKPAAAGLNRSSSDDGMAVRIHQGRAKDVDRLRDPAKSHVYALLSKVSENPLPLERPD